MKRAVIRCPKCRTPIPWATDNRKIGAAGGKIGGARTSARKRAAARANASKPPRPGSRPRGRPRKGQPSRPGRVRVAPDER